MGRMNLTLKLLATSLTVIALTGCSKQSSEPASEPSAAKETANNTPLPPPPPIGSQPVAPPKMPSASGTVSQERAPTGAETAAATNQEDAVAAAKEIATAEKEYRDNTDFTKRVESIFRIADAGTGEAVPALGRLFASETDADLKTQIVDALTSIDGQDDQKLALLSAAVGASQPKDVREAAIDALTDLESPEKGIPILQSLASDPDSEIRDDVKDALEVIQATTTATK